MNTEQKISLADDRLAIRNLVDQYAFFADSRDAQGQMDLFTDDTVFEVYYDPKSRIPSEVINSKKDLFPVFDNLNSYDTTMHFNGQHSVEFKNTTASGITYCLAHHLNMVEGKQKFMIAAIRYEDEFTKQDNKWLFSKRKLLVQWIENR